MYVAAIIPAAGIGRRMGMGRNKAFLPLQGKPVLVHTLDVLRQCSIIDEIVVAVGEDDLDWCRTELRHLISAARCQFVTGGSTRQESVHRCLLAADSSTDVFVVHDAARPLVTPEIVQSVILAASDTGAAVCAVPAKDTVRISHDGEFFHVHLTDPVSGWFRRLRSFRQNCCGPHISWQQSGDLSVRMTHTLLSSSDDASLSPMVAMRTSRSRPERTSH